jgi:predicted TPR repeat methyltransferase
MSQESSGNDIADRRFEMAVQLYARGEMDAAIDILEQTLEIAPQWLALHFRLGEIYMSMGERDKAVHYFSECLKLDKGDRMGAMVKLTLLGAINDLQTLPAPYVESLFDDYAPRFDTALVERLGYRVPELLAGAVEAIRPYKTDTSERILDLGCGTGLSGEVFAKRAAWLEGVDMSAGMLAQATIKGIYNYTEHAEAHAFLQSCSKRYNLIVAADVLVYMGDIQSLFIEIARCLDDGGLFVFSTQILESGTYRLGHDHRYAHSADYIHHCATQTGMTRFYLEKTFIRHDGTDDIYGQIAVYGKPAHKDFSALPQILTNELQLGGNEQKT